MNFPFIVVLVAAVGGLASESFLRSVAPELGPALALVLMAGALIAGARLLARRPEVKGVAAERAAEAQGVQRAGDSFNPV